MKIERLKEVIDKTTYVIRFGEGFGPDPDTFSASVLYDDELKPENYIQIRENRVQRGFDVRVKDLKALIEFIEELRKELSAHLPKDST